MTNISNYSFDTLLCGKKTDEYYKTHVEEKTLCNIMEIGQVSRDIIENKQLSTNKKIILPDVSKIDVKITKNNIYTINNYNDPVDYYDYKYISIGDVEYLYVVFLSINDKLLKQTIFYVFKINMTNNITDTFKISLKFTDMTDNEFDIYSNFIMKFTFEIIDNITYFSFGDIYFIDFNNDDIKIDFFGEKYIELDIKKKGLINNLTNIDTKNDITHLSTTYIVNKIDDKKILLLADVPIIIPGGVHGGRLVGGIALIELEIPKNDTTSNYNYIRYRTNRSVSTRDITSNKSINNFNYLFMKSKNKVIIINNTKINNDYDMLSIDVVNINDIFLYSINNDYFYVIHKDNTIYFNYIGKIITTFNFPNKIDFKYANKIEEPDINNIYLYKNLLFVESDETILLYKIDFKNNKSVCLSRNLYTGSNINSFRVNSNGTCLIINDDNKFISIKFN
jgi:hypothetical protein